MEIYCQPRRGFTLVELLVVMFLIAVLATLAIAFFPSAASSQVEARAATQLQGWLNMAKQRAMRDQAPRGLRLWVNNTSFYAGPNLVQNVVTDCQFIEMPPDYPGNSGMTIMTGLPGGATAAYITSAGTYFYAVGLHNRAQQSPPNQPASMLSSVMFMPPPGLGYSNNALANGDTGILTNGLTAQLAVPNSPAQVEYWTVQPGDYLEVLGTGLMHQIVQIGVPIVQAGHPQAATTTNHVDYAVVTPPLPYAIGQTPNFRIIRAPRVTGDDTLKMPDGTVIDLTTNLPPPAGFNNPLPYPNGVGAADNGTAMGAAAPFIDILFSPTGEVISAGVANSNINLWVRAPNGDHPTDVFRGAPTIISVFTKSGFVGAYPPNPNNAANPYSLIK